MTTDPHDFDGPDGQPRPDPSGDGAADLGDAGFSFPTDDDGLLSHEEPPAGATPAGPTGELPIAAAETPPVSPPTGGLRGDGRGGRRGRRASGSFLGVYVTEGTVYGALMQAAGTEYRVLRRFARQRNAAADVAETPDLPALTAESPAEGDGDVTIQFGQQGAGDDLFLGTEFGDIATLGDLDDVRGDQKRQASPVVFELKDLLDECAAAGHERPDTAFCIGQPAVRYVELLLPEGRRGKKADDKKPKGDKRPKEDSGGEGAEALPAVKRDVLLDRLSEVHEEPFEKDRVGFVPMTPRDGVRRFLAAVPTAEDALAESLDLLREQSGMRSVPLRAIDAEVPLLMGLSRWAFPPEQHESTAVVRVGTEDTLVILLQGDELHHQEHMVGVSAFDSPETICSRVLLQQDVQGVGTVHRVVVLSEEQESEVIEAFSAFYPDAQVEPLQHGLRDRGVVLPSGGADFSAAALPAVGVALRAAAEREKGSPFGEVNLLPKRLRRVRPRLDLAVAWHTLVASVLLFFTVLFFVGLYFSQQAEVAAAEERVAAYPAELNLSSQALQAQIDSLQNVHVRVTQTLDVIDSLLVGSDRWSRSLSRLSRATASTGGAWVQQWDPQGSSVQLAGHATSRAQVVQFAERLGGSIDELRFASIRDYPVFSYVLTAPVPSELPEVARYLREQADVPTAPAPDPLGDALSDVAP